MEITLYHGTLEEYAIDIMASNRFSHSDGEKHYLGKGMYFYSDPGQAMVWAKMKSNSENKNARKFPAIPRVLQIQVETPEDSYIDLDLREAQNLFFKHRDRYYSAVKAKELAISHYTDSHFCDFLCSKIFVRMMSKTFVYVQKYGEKIPVRYTNDKRTNRDITRHYWTEKQYCLKDDALIKSITILEGGDYLE